MLNNHLGISSHSMIPPISDSYGRAVLADGQSLASISIVEVSVLSEACHAKFRHCFLGTAFDGITMVIADWV